MITQEQFLKALTHSKAFRPQDMELLVAWYNSDDRAISAEQVIDVTGAKRAALIINNLGKRIAGFLETEVTGSAAIADESNVDCWTMKNELAQAMVQHGVVAVPSEVGALVEEKVEAAVEQMFEPEVGSLESLLADFDRTTIQAFYPNTPTQCRLLQPEMIKVLAAKRPTTKSAYQRAIPATLRKNISTQESRRFLSSVLTLLKNF